MFLYDYILFFSWDRSFYMVFDFVFFSEIGRGYSMYIIIIFIWGEIGDFFWIRKVVF